MEPVKNGRLGSPQPENSCALWRHRGMDLVADFYKSIRSAPHAPRSIAVVVNELRCSSSRPRMALFLLNRVRYGKIQRRTIGARQTNKGGIHMKSQACMLTFLLTCATAVVTMPIISHAEDTIQRTVRGIVVATNIDVDPKTIVVKVLLPKKEELIVGARVPPDTRITRGKQAVRLADVKTGETAEISYLKTSDGLIARSIHVR